MAFTTEQEEFWAGEFGDAYTSRNDSADIVAANTALFSAVLRHLNSPKTILEFGANRGMNLLALRALLPAAAFTAIEINKSAFATLSTIEGVRAVQTSILDYVPAEKFDLAFIKGVLIHIAPEELANVYAKLYGASRRHILIAEYYSPQPVEIPYRGHQNKLFKRDFAGEMLDMYADLRLVDYGFRYHRDSAFPLDDITWFLLEKTGHTA